MKWSVDSVFLKGIAMELQHVMFGMAEKSLECVCECAHVRACVARG